jgi:hypothetical protein
MAVATVDADVALGRRGWRRAVAVAIEPAERDAERVAEHDPAGDPVALAATAVTSST